MRRRNFLVGLGVTAAAAEFAFTFHPRRDLTLRYAEGSAPAPVATTAQPGKSNSHGELRTG